MVHALQKFGKYSRVNTRLNAWAHWYIFFVGRILLFLMGRWALSSHSFLGEQPCEFCFCPLLWWCRGFCSCLVIHFFVTNCLLFVLPFHNLLSLCNFSFCVLFPSSLFLPTCPVPPRSPELCCFVRGVFVTVPFLRKHGSRKLHPPYQVSVPAPQHVGGFVWDFLGKWVPYKASVSSGLECRRWLPGCCCCCCCCLGLLQFCFFP